MIMAFLKPRDVFRVYVFGALIAFGNTCGPSEYKSSKGECCPMCNIGSVVYGDCIGDSSTTCIPCSPGTFMNEPNGIYACFPCKHCSESQGLYIQSHCTRMKDTICDVLDGYHCVESSNSQCGLAQKHSVCKPGQETKTPEESHLGLERHEGTKRSDTVCVDCPSGFYSPAGVNCTRWTNCAAKEEIEAEAGSSIKDVTCKKMIHGRYGLIGTLLAVLIAAFIFIYICLKNLSKSRLPKHPTEETNFDSWPSTSQQMPEENKDEDETFVCGLPIMEHYTSTNHRQPEPSLLDT